MSFRVRDLVDFVSSYFTLISKTDCNSEWYSDIILLLPWPSPYLCRVTLSYLSFFVRVYLYMLTKNCFPVFVKFLPSYLTWVYINRVFLLLYKRAFGHKFTSLVVIKGIGFWSLLGLREVVHLPICLTACKYGIWWWTVIFPS